MSLTTKQMIGIGVLVGGALGGLADIAYGLLAPTTSADATRTDKLITYGLPLAMAALGGLIGYGYHRFCNSHRPTAELKQVLVMSTTNKP